MKKKFVYLALLLVFSISVLFLRTMLHEIGTTEANTIKIENGLIVNAAGTPMSGTLLGKPNHIEALWQPFLELVASLDDWQKLPVGRKLNLNHLHQMQEELDGFSVQAQVEEGQLKGETSVWFDLRKGKEEIFGYPLCKSLKYYLAYLFHNQMKLAEMHFEENQLHGDAILYGPGTNKTLTKWVAANFKNNELSTVRRFHSNGNIKRINHYHYFVKDGLQQEYHSSGPLTYEALYEAGKKQSEKFYYWTNDKLRKQILYEGSQVADEKHYFPNGELAKDYQGENRTEWYSNGDIKLHRTPDSMFHAKPKGTIETYHSNGLLARKYQYDPAGVLNGPYEIYYRSGALWEQGTYKKGKREGRFRKWFTNGQIAEDHQMISGKIDGPFVRYYDSGVKWKAFNYDMGLLTGQYKKWWKNGQLAFDCEYQDNVATACRKWNDSGEPIK